MITIPVQLNEIDVEKIDALVAMGRYKSRNQAIRTLLLDRLANESFVDAKESEELIKKRQRILQKIEAKKIPFEIRVESGKSAAELIFEERDR